MKTSIQNRTNEAASQPVVSTADKEAPSRVANRRQPAIHSQLDSASQLGHRFDALDVQPTLAAGSAVMQRQGADVGSAGTLQNASGLPQPLKTGIENLSGTSLDDVRVHYNSPKPADLEALAYTQGSEIHVGPDQEQHLPHEAWHAVQQKQGRVKATRQLKGRGLNDSAALEREAEVMGHKANAQPTSQLGSAWGRGSSQQKASPIPILQDGHSGAGNPSAVQLMKFSQLKHFLKKKLRIPEKHLKGNTLGTLGKTTKASQEVMDHAKAQIEGDVAEQVGEANQGNDYVFEVPRKHRHKKGSAKSRRFNVHKGGGKDDKVDFFMQEGQPPESESSEDEDEN